MTTRELQDSQEDFDELLSMFMELEAHQNVSFFVYLTKLLDMLKINGSKCFIFEQDRVICAFSIIYPDFRGGCIGQSLYIKPEFRKKGLFLKIFSQLSEYVADNFDYCDLVATNDEITKLYDKMGLQKIQTIYRYKER